jgi:hypothetical protein
MASKKNSKKNTSLRLDREMLKALKRHALERETSVQQMIEMLIRRYLKSVARKEESKPEGMAVRKRRGKALAAGAGKPGAAEAS